MNYDNDIIKITNRLLIQLPDKEPFVFEEQYQNFQDSINAKVDHIFYLSVILFREKVFRFMDSHNYFEQYKDGRDILSEKGQEAKRLGHEDYQKRLIAIKDEKWYNSKLAKEQYEDYDKTKSRAVRSERISIIAVILTIIGLILQWKCNNHG